MFKLWFFGEGCCDIVIVVFLGFNITFSIEEVFGGFVLYYFIDEEIGYSEVVF